MMGKALPFVMLGFGAVFATLSVVELWQYRSFRQNFVKSGWLPGKGETTNGGA